jgi:hypothetical protein
MSRVNLLYVEGALARLNLPVGGTDAQKVARLEAHYKRATPRNRLADCDTCSKTSDIDEPMCPFCGDAGVVTPPEEANAVVVAEPTVVVSVPARVSDLDAAVERIQHLKQRATESIWELGTELRGIFDKRLWKTRQNAEGGPAYTTWGAFCEAELGISSTYSYKMMDVAQAYTREQVRQIGATKLSLTLQVPREAREKLLTAAASGATVRQLTEMVVETGRIRPETGRTARGGGGTHKTSGRTGRKKVRFMAPQLLGRSELYPASISGKHAKFRISHPIACEEMLVGGIKQRFVLTNDADGRVMLIVERSKG